MFALYATNHAGLTAIDVASLPAMPGRSHLIRWLETGGECRLANSEYLGDLRKLRRALSERGLQTEIRDAHAVTPPPVAAVPSGSSSAQRYIPSVDSGVHEYRSMMADIERNRGSRAYKAASTFTVGRLQVAAAAAFALVGLLFAFAA